jgi:hypothetical protein
MGKEVNGLTRGVHDPDLNPLAELSEPQRT